MARTDKLAKLIAVFDQFHESISNLNDQAARQLVDSWTGIRHQYVNPVGGPRSAYAAGMEQGLRETPMLFQSMQSEARKSASRALAEAISDQYPEFLNKDSARLAKIKMRGSIRSESEFHLVRHYMDVLEGAPSKGEELHQLYALVDRFEGRRR